MNSLFSSIASFYDGSKITQLFTGDTPTPDDPNGHHGIDYANPAGTPIPALFSGRVVAASTDPNNPNGLGYSLAIDSGNGIVTTYGHMLNPPQYSVGSTVGAGYIIGDVGSTGNSTGPHTHVGVQQNGVFIDPSSYVYLAVADASANITPDAALNGQTVDNQPILTGVRPPDFVPNGSGSPSGSVKIPSVTLPFGIGNIIPGAGSTIIPGSAIDAAGNIIDGPAALAGSLVSIATDLNMWSKIASDAIKAPGVIITDVGKVLTFATSSKSWWSLAFILGGVGLFSLGVYLYSEDVREVVNKTGKTGAEVAAVA